MTTTKPSARHFSRDWLEKRMKAIVEQEAIAWCDRTPFPERYADRLEAYRKGMARGFSKAISMLMAEGVVTV